MPKRVTGLLILLMTFLAACSGDSAELAMLLENPMANATLSFAEPELRPVS